MRRRATMIRSAVLACGLLAAGCGSVSTPPGPSPEPVALDPATVAALVETHNHRVRQLRQLYSSGVIELEWIDEEGQKHREPQIDMQLWLQLPRRSALRADKLGEVVLWLGSDDQRYWLFDLMSEESELRLGAHDEGDAPAVADLLVKPLALIDLLALTPIVRPAGGPGATAIHTAVDGDPGLWRVSASGAGGPMHLYFDPVTRLPVRVETLRAEGGEVLLVSELDDPESVRVPGVSIAALPRMPTRIEIADPPGRLRISLYLGEPAADDPRERWDRVFDLPRLIAALRPDHVPATP